jgi:hypothetical protein
LFVGVLGEVDVVGYVVEVDLEARQRFEETGEVRPARQRIEEAVHRLKIVDHGSAHDSRNLEGSKNPRVANRCAAVNYLRAGDPQPEVRNSGSRP